MPALRYALVAWLLAAVVPDGAPATLDAQQRTPPAPAASNGQVQIVLEGGAFRSEVVTLPQTGGDWFASPRDAHASLSFTGTYKGAPAQLALQWDGRASSHIIDEDRNSDAGGEHVTFFLSMSGQAPLNFSAAPRNEDIVTIAVTKMDEMDLQASLSGTVTSSEFDDTGRRNAVVTVHAMVILHRAAAPSRPTTGTYTDCDNIIWDKLAGAQDRSPSECEVKFDADVRKTLSGAFEKVTTAFSASPWGIEADDPPDLLKGVGRGTEKAPFSIEPYAINARMDPASAQYQAYRARYEDLTDKFRREVNASLGTMGPAYQAMLKLLDEVNGATKVGVQVAINQQSGGFVSFTADHRVLQVPGAAYAIAASRVAPPTGGSVEESLPNVSFVYLGSWKPATFEKLTEGGERMRIASSLGAGTARLSVQNVVIRIESNPALTDAVLKQIDFAALQKLLAR